MQQTYNYVGTLEYKAKEAIVINIILLIISIGLCFYSFWIINFRVIYPINYMVSALLDATRGNQVRINPAMIARNDEIGKLGQVLSILQKTNERYRALVEASSKIIWIWMPGEQDSGMAALHKWWEEVTGQPGGEMHDFGWLKVVHPDDREYMKKAWSESSTLGKEFKVEHRLMTKKGTYRHVSVRGVPLKNEDGSVREVVGALNDITDRKEAEIQLKLYMQDLERSNKELDDFAYIASHDLKEPLRGIHNHARFLLEDNQEKLEEDSVKRLGRLIYLSQRMERLVNDLLYFSRLGRQELAIGKTDINDIITDIENTIDVFLKDHNAKILIPKKLPQKITCDTTRITEVFRNLITNAVKYNDKAAKTVEIGFLEKYTAKDGEILLIPHNIS